MAKKKEEGTPVRPQDKVEIEYTNKSKHNAAGKKSFVHPVQAEKLKEKGHAKIVGQVVVGKIRTPDKQDDI